MAAGDPGVLTCRSLTRCLFSPLSLTAAAQPGKNPLLLLLLLPGMWPWRGPCPCRGSGVGTGHGDGCQWCHTPRCVTPADGGTWITQRALSDGSSPPASLRTPGDPACSGMSPLLWLGGFGFCSTSHWHGCPWQWGVPIPGGFEISVDVALGITPKAELPVVASCGSELFCRVFCRAFCSLEFSHVQ